MTAAARTRDPVATRTAILDAAEARFADVGFAATPLAEVARAAGVTKSLIHHHFGSKDALWDAVLDRRFGEYGKRQAAILERPDVDLSTFEDSVRTFFAFLLRNPSFVRLHAWANAGGSLQRHALRDELVARGVARLREMQERGEIRPDIEPASVLILFFNTVEHWFQARPSLDARFGPLRPDDSTFLEDLVRVLIQGIRPCGDPE